MLKIGEFSKLTRVSVKALRHYDEIGLLRPIRVDPFTGYRFYGHDQLPRLNRILALRELGFALQQVGQMLEEGVTPDQLRGMLRLRRAELVEQLDEGRERLARVEARLKQIEQEGKMPEYEVVVKNVEPQLVASVRDRLGSYGEIGRLFGELYGYLGPLGAAGLGASLWHDGEFKESDVDGEAIAFLSRPVPESGRVKVYELPGATVASLVHRGTYGSIDQAYAALMGWIEANGYRLAGPDREIYLEGGTNPDDASYVTEIQQPVEKA
ncbi:MAG: transcriptional regulator [Chloroflexi bacterium RBG_13_66_10]|nr:MAG: transcriptional regulator [Chloroflexi bacterium RBG_13_66_10]